MKAIVRPLSVWDIHTLSQRLRLDDQLELAAMGSTPHHALLEGLNLSTACWAVEYDGEVQAAFGVAPFPGQPGTGIPWMLATDRILDFKRQFLKESRTYILAMLSMYPRLTNMAFAHNKLTLRWLQWLGCNLSRTLSVEPTGLPFIEFEMTTHV